ncbi:uncharacterized protein AMSG_10297 [Thecamonas trahens ATCC 50062]|uniref:Uncharacterized protein n=1 Tax=Thecamonas trahens ATCC 50062 TaxID=461836 RepID=A0A0L0DS82_THETB|nr:hypothetical protein AMSG_10297 [Thecamonas trahens ATCC 50062]KNC54313.1 hypothetical protein AMSG_10297 [Thecamonas trahens ATCC 50062]|eukprot:XP_013753774.1 hypothetical protein AMSG_10297 [Thecamonas trahens ATCC 50062]
MGKDWRNLMSARTSMLSLARASASLMARQSSVRAARGGGPLPWGVESHGFPGHGSSVPFKVVGASNASIAARVASLIALGIGLPIYGVIHSNRNN